MMRITRIRLVNFHNFVDETIDVAEGGHLFLLGDNGSGKTTVLDAVHYVLGGGQLELNAAARIGGNRAEGRKIQGIVLRLDFERGVRNEEGAIAYAAVELCDPDSGRCLVAGVGTEATTMEARATKWGFVTGRPLDEIPLVTRADDGARFPTTREQLRAAMSTSEVYFRIGDYRAALAARLFGGVGAYDEVCRFWSMAKAYREIVSGARNFEALFQRLLPAPDPAVFGEIARSLRNIADMEVALHDLDQQRDYVGGLLELSQQIAAQRELQSRLRWLVGYRRVEETGAEQRDAEDEIARLTSERDRLAREAAAAEARSDQADDAARAAEAEDADGLAERLRRADARAAECDGELAAGERDEAEQQRRTAAANEAAATARAALDERRIQARAGLAAAIDATAELPGELPRIRRLHAAMAADGPGTWQPTAAPAGDEADGLARVTERRQRELADAVQRARADEERFADALAELRRRREEQPRVARFAAARAALAADGIEARAIYELLEPRADAPAHALAAVEALAGDDQLAALVVDADARDRAAALVVDHAPGVRVVVATDDGAALPDWVGALFDADRADPVALAALAAAITQSPAFGSVGAPAGVAVDHRGARFAPADAAPRLLGRAARERAHRARVDAAEAERAEATRIADAAAEACDDAGRRLANARALCAAVAAATAAALVQAETVAGERGVAAARELELLERSAARTATLRQRAEAARAQADALRARADAVGLDELETRIAALRDAAKQARDAWKRAQGQLATCDHRIEGERGRLTSLAARGQALAADLARLTDELRARVPALAGAGDAAVSQYVRIDQRGDSYKNIANIQERIDRAGRRETEVRVELAGDGTRGVRNIQFAPRFGFVYQADANHLADRRDQPAGGVLADLDRTLAEQRGVITGETRELMETLIVSSLARDLQTQVDTLERLIKNINALLADLRFGRSEYQFRATPRKERRELIEIVKRVSVLDADSRSAFRAWIEDRLDELRGAADDDVPAILDYRTWFDYSLRMRTEDSDGVDLTRSVRALGSGGEQGVPNYLLVLALAKLMFDTSGARLQPLLFDEAFYGIDAGRRDQLLRFATELGLQLLVASPDQDGVTTSVRNATTLFIVKDANGDVHLAPYHFWHRAPDAQRDLFAADEPTRPPPDDAECRI